MPLKQLVPLFENKIFPSFATRGSRCEKGEITINVFDITGQLVLSKKYNADIIINNTVKIKTEKLKEGAYILKASINGLNSSQLIIKQ